MDGVVVRKRIYLEDLDGFGVVHHARYAILLDNAVLDFWLDAGWTPDTRAGRTSVSYRFEVLSTDHSVLHAEGHRVLVNIDAKTLRPSPLTEAMWQIAAPLLAEGVERPAA